MYYTSLSVIAFRHLEGVDNLDIVEKINSLDEGARHQLNELLTRLIASRVIKAGDVVFDCGANHGYHTSDFSERVGPDGLVHAFEPNPDLFPGLVGPPNVRVWPVAVGDRISVETFILPVGRDEVGSLVDPQDWIGQTEVRKLTVIQVPIDAIPEAIERPVSFIKIDVERHEAAALTGLQQTIRKYNPIIVYENNSLEIEAILGRIGYKVVHMLTRVGPIGMPNVIAVPLHREDEIGQLLPSPSDLEEIISKI